MFSDFSKLETFLAVVREKSFSKASLSLGISQPAVTQQLKLIEEYLNAKVVDRKKNGISLTKEGELLYEIALKVEKSVISAQKELFHIMSKNNQISVASSFLVAEQFWPKISNKLNLDDIKVQTSSTVNAINQLRENRVEVALVEEIIPYENIIYKVWFEDELVLFSNEKLPVKLKDKDLLKYKWICQPNDCQTMVLLNSTLNDMPECERLSDANKSNVTSSLIHAVLTAKKLDIIKEQTVSIIFRSVIENMLKEKSLFEAKIGNHKMKKKLYIAYNKNNEENIFLQNFIKYLIKFDS